MPSAQQGNRVKYQEIINYDKNPPIFSLEKLQTGNYCFSKLNQEHKAMFAEAIFRRKNLTWENIKKADRHGLGTEKIAKNSIKAPMPRFITDEVADFLVFRYNDTCPMVGYRHKDIFFVLWFDHNFTLYNHS
ncbi:hypothetical protein NEIELOOT_02709 [Neisseria elongata subsp. glycolytica ATCC 29315]|nr:hypothetical protein NEIELOOT_02709 [Neisseria elongata subsp. glycolytica ATCC 29315]